MTCAAQWLEHGSPDGMAAALVCLACRVYGPHFGLAWSGVAGWELGVSRETHGGVCNTALDGCVLQVMAEAMELVPACLAAISVAGR